MGETFIVEKEKDPSESSLNGSFSFSIGTGMAELERMKSREPIIFSQMSVNILRYIATDLPGDVIKGLLTYRSGDPCLTSVTSAPSSSDDLDCDLSVEWPQIFSWDSQYSNVNLLIKYLENYSEKEGIFRIPGNSVRVQRLKQDLTNHNLIDLAKKKYTHNDVSSALKQLLKQAPGSLIPDTLHKAHIAVADITLELESRRQQVLLSWQSYEDSEITESEIFDDISQARDRHIEALQILLFLMPTEKWSVLKNLVELLHTIAKKQSVNKMSATNLATIFTPHLLWPSCEKKRKDPSRHKGPIDNNMSTEFMNKACYAITFMIRHCNRIFEPHFEMVERVRSYYKTQRSLQISSTVDLTFCKNGKSWKGSASHKGPRSIKRMLFPGSNHNGSKRSKEEPSQKFKPTHGVEGSNDLVSRDEEQSGGHSRSKRSRSLGSVFRNKVTSRVEEAARNVKKAGQNCAAQQLFVDSETSGFPCASPGGISYPGYYHLLV